MNSRSRWALMVAIKDLKPFIFDSDGLLTLSCWLTSERGGVIAAPKTQPPPEVGSRLDSVELGK